MKEIKKLGKFALAGLMAGATITGASANLSDYPNPFMEDGSVNTQIVVGDNAKTADVVSAINIAGSLGNSAFKSTSVTSASVDGKSYETSIRSALSQGLIDASDYSKLARETVTDVNDTEHFVVEKVGVSGTAQTVVNKTDVLTTFGTGALKYTVSYTPGFNAGAEIPVLGENYEITSINNGASPASVELGSTKQNSELAVGDSYDHGPYTVEVTDADKNNNEVFVRVSKDETVLKSSALSQGESFTADSGALEVSADQIFFGQEDHITLSSTWTNTEVTDGEQSPFDENYDASLSFSSGQLTGITLTNNVAAVQNPADDSGNIPALDEGESFAGPQDYFQFTYQGLSSENTEDVTVKNDHKVTYQDVLGFSHTLDASTLAASGGPSLVTGNPWTGTDSSNIKAVMFNDDGDSVWESSTTDVIVTDDDEDDVYTASADTQVDSSAQDSIVAGDTLTAFSAVTERVAVEGTDTTWTSGEKVVVDLDSDSQYTDQPDFVWDTDYNSTTTNPSTADISNGDTGITEYTSSTGTEGALYYYDATSNGLTDDDDLYQENASSADAGAFDGPNAGDRLLAVGSDGSQATTGGSVSGFATGDNVYIEGADSSYNKNGGTGSNGEDVIINYYDGSTYSAQVDTAISADTGTGGATLTVLDGTGNLVYHNADGAGDWDQSNANANGYEDIYDESVDGELTYSSGADSPLAGTAPGAGVTLTASNPWSSASSPVAFYDGGTSGTWESGNDLIAVDEDDSGTYDSGTDTQLAGTSPGNDGVLDNGQGTTTVYTDISGHPVKVAFDDTADEATISYQSFSTTVAVTSSKNVDTGYGFTLNADFTSDGGDGNTGEDLVISGTDTVLNTRFGSQVRYQSPGVDGSSPDVQVDENGDGFNFADSDGVDVAVSYDGSGNVDQVTTDDSVVDLTSANSKARTNFGTVLSAGSGMDSVSLTLPENQLNALHALGELKESSSGRLSPTGFPEAGELASEASKSENMILVGGPKVNSLVKELATAGKTWTSSKYRNNQGVGLIDYVGNAFDSSTALVVAGWSAQDTAAASEFLANYEANADKLEGSRVKVDTDTGKVVK